jgi:hypothetical protein
VYQRVGQIANLSAGGRRGLDHLFGERRQYLVRDRREHSERLESVVDVAGHEQRSEVRRHELDGPAVASQPGQHLIGTPAVERVGRQPPGIEDEALGAYAGALQEPHEVSEVEGKEALGVGPTNLDEHRPRPLLAIQDQLMVVAM